MTKPYRNIFDKSNRNQSQELTLLTPPTIVYKLSTVIFSLFNFSTVSASVPSTILGLFILVL